MTDAERMQYEDRLFRIGAIGLARRCERCDQYEVCEFTSNPFAHEIHDDDTPGWYCEPCLQDLRDDI